MLNGDAAGTRGIDDVFAGGRGLIFLTHHPRPTLEMEQRGWLAIDYRCPVCRLCIPTEALIRLADGFEPWEAAVDNDNQHYWAEDMGPDLDAEDRRLLGYDEGKVPE